MEGKNQSNCGADAVIIAQKMGGTPDQLPGVLGSDNPQPHQPLEANDFTDGEDPELYPCGCSNRAAVLNAPKVRPRRKESIES